LIHPLISDKTVNAEIPILIVNNFTAYSDASRHSIPIHSAT
jgi:hypothetical protein